MNFYEGGHYVNDVRNWIRVALVCETVGCLPNPGGLFQQDDEHVWKLEAVYRARSVRQLDEAKEKQTHG